MAFGSSLFLIAVGAILTFAVTAEFAGVDIDVVGIILMAVGGIGVLISLLMWQEASWLGFRRDRADEHHVHDERV